MDPINNHSTPEQKIALYRSFFRGRSDVYARRFVAKKTGKAGYSPVCGNEWIRGVCEKPKIKCSDCSHQCWNGITDDVIRWHLSGQDSTGKEFIMGIYPMLLDESCYFLAVDFDGDGWQEEVTAFIKVCLQMNISATLERSRSGNGGHVWIFFEEAIPSTLARSLGSHILTLATELCPQTKLKSYDRFFPNQDTLPRGGFGNLIALPLQKRPREMGNSIFIDEAFTPYPDQWGFLASISKIPTLQIETIISSARRKGTIIGVNIVPTEDNDEPWKAAPSRKPKKLKLTKKQKPASIEVTLSDQLYIPKKDLPPPLHNALVRLAAFQNPEFYKAQAMRLPTYDKPRIIACAEDYPEHIGIPRGCLEEVKNLLDEQNIPLKIDDKRYAGETLDLTFQGALHPEQQVAMDALVKHETGILAATTAFGKTVLAAAMIANRGVSTLILVHRKQLMDQWLVRLEQFLDIDKKEIGRLGGGRKKLTGKIDIALIQSLVRKGEVKDLVADYGHLIIDECHHLSANSFEQVARRAKAKFILGLSATITRKDGHHPILFMQCGPIRHTVSAKGQAAKRPFTHEVIVRPTGFRMPIEIVEDPRIAFQNICDTLYKDPNRNKLIASEIINAIRAGKTPLVLTERTEHIALLHQLLEPELPHIITLKGGMTTKALKAALASLTDIPLSEPRVILATGRFVGEGFDDSRLDTLFLTMPVSWKGTIAQYAGRLHRLHDGKKLVQIHDYADLDIPMLSRMFDRRCAGYEEVGYTILLPAHALPGWPPEVPLPIDPQWKNDYAASVRRLIQDGVDAPLATLFVHATQPPAKGSKGEQRARSASEKFLYQRLQTLPPLKDKFQLNAHLLIPFNQHSQMEVDFLFAEKKIVIELDGEQHLTDKKAYRNDRRKDLLLQQRGYLILRFLTTDLSQNLDQILDSIQRVIASR